MNITSIIGKKIDQTQGFLEDGKRVPLSIINVAGNVVAQVKTMDHEGYNAVQLGFDTTKRNNKPTLGHIKKAGLDQKSPRFFRETRVDDVPSVEVGAEIAVAEVFEPGDIVDVTGTSKGKGFAGVVKKYRFAGGPKTHGQSDRHRARGSSGSGTTPGRVYKGKKMAGRMGNEQVTVKNLEILGIDGDTLLVRGLVPGIKGAIVMIKKVGKNKNFTPLWSEKPVVIEVVEEELHTEEVKAEEPQQSSDVEQAAEATTAEEVVETASDTVETASDTVTTAEEEVVTPEETVETPEAPVEEKTEEIVEEKTEGEQNAS